MPYHLRRLFALLALLAVQPLAAQTYPSQPIRMVSPFPPGGSVDIMARLIADPLGNQLGTRIIIDNRSGASGNIGMEAAARAAPDGYTVVLNTIPLVTNKSLFDKLNWDPIKDFAPIGMVATGPHVLVVHPKLPVAKVEDLVRLARASPGKLSYASAGVGTTFHFCAEMFKDETGTNIVHVPHKASGEMRNSVIGGHVQMAFDAITTMTPNVKAGQVRALGTSASKRSTVLPDVPTIAEAGVPGYDSTIWLGIMAPAGTPKPIVDKLNAEINKAINRPDVKEAWDKQGAAALTMTPAEFDAYLRKDIDKWAQVVKAAGIKPE